MCVCLYVCMLLLFLSSRYFSDTSKFQSFIAGDGLLHIKPSLVIMEDIDSLWQCSTSDIDRFALTSAVCRDACR